MNMFGAYKIMLCRNIPEIGKIPCQIVTKCPSAPLISEDTEILVLDENKVHYKCKDEKFFDYPQLEYPQQVEAVCSQGELFQGLLPFWKIDNVTFPYKESPKCLSSSECSSFSKSFSTELINTYEESNDLGSSFSIFCHMDGLRGLANFATENEDKEPVDAIKEDTKYFLYRTGNVGAMISLRVNSDFPVYIYLVNSTKEIVNNSYCLKIENGNIKLYNCAYPWNEFKETMIEEDSIPLNDGDLHDIWIAIGASKKLYIGSFNDENEKITYAFYDISNLDLLNYIGFSSFGSASWEVQNGIKFL